MNECGGEVLQLGGLGMVAKVKEVRGCLVPVTTDNGQRTTEVKGHNKKEVGSESPQLVFAGWMAGKLKQGTTTLRGVAWGTWAGRFV